MAIQASSIASEIEPTTPLSITENGNK